jgi:peptidoglycan/LPS O-acetylase OafA/YrhL
MTIDSVTVERVPIEHALGAQDSPILRPRMPELDHLRGVAILNVFLYHAFFWSGIGATSGWVAGLFATLTRPGWLGVDLFFVLSGFLITGALLDHRTLGPREFYRWFYLRRALRILPLYYLTLVIVGTILLGAGQTSISFLLLSGVYLPNIALIAGAPAAYPLAVLWSLGIEEQAYLVWPLAVRAANAGGLTAVFGLLCVVEPALRYGTASIGLLPETISMATWLRLDGFAWGALVAILVRTAWCNRRRLAAVGAVAVLVALTAACLCAASDLLTRRKPVGAAMQLASADLLFGGVVALALVAGSRFPEIARRGRFLQYFGAISYCLYLVHQFAFWTFDRFVSIDAAPRALISRAAIVLAVSVGVAELSRRYIERPCLALRPRAPLLVATP